jgi:hypothetical protein
MLPTLVRRGALYPEEYGVVQPLLVETNPLAVVAQSAPDAAARVIRTETRLRHLTEGLRECTATVVEMIRSPRSPETKVFRVSYSGQNDDDRLFFSDRERTRCQVVAEFL